MVGFTVYYQENAKFWLKCNWKKDIRTKKRALKTLVKLTQGKRLLLNAIG